MLSGGSPTGRGGRLNGNDKWPGTKNLVFKLEAKHVISTNAERDRGGSTSDLGHVVLWTAFLQRAA